MDIAPGRWQVPSSGICGAGSFSICGRDFDTLNQLALQIIRLIVCKDLSMYLWPQKPAGEGRRVRLYNRQQNAYLAASEDNEVRQVQLQHSFNGSILDQHCRERSFQV
jgi:hypothetical protein